MTQQNIIKVEKAEVDVFENMLEPDKKKETTNLDVLKELFETKNIKTKTELSPQQVVLLNQKRTIAKILGWESLNTCLDDFMFLMVSKNREGRKEFVDGFKGERDRESGKGFFNNMREKFGFE